MEVEIAPLQVDLEHAQDDGSGDSDDEDARLDDAGRDESEAIPVPLCLEEAIIARKAALREHRSQGDCDRVCDNLGVRMHEGIFLRDKFQGDKYLAKIVPCFKGTTMCCTCQEHPGCKFLLSVKPAKSLHLPEVQADIIAWASAASVLSRDEHQELAAHVKVTHYGMKRRR